MELDHQGPDEDYNRGRHTCCSQGWWRGHERETCQTGQGERQAKSWERIGDSKQRVCIYFMLILLTFHGHYCFAVTDREEGRGGKDMNASQAAGQTCPCPKRPCINMPPVSFTA